MSMVLPCLYGTLRRLSRALTAACDEALAPSGLRITQFSILRMLSRVGPAAVTRLAAEVAADRSTMGRNLDPLERRGLVRLTTGKKDQRERIVGLTETGLAALGLRCRSGTAPKMKSHVACRQPQYTISPCG